MSDKICLITGVGPGTGASLTRRFAAEGYRVAMLARDAARLNALAAETPAARPYVCDVSDPEQIAATVAKVTADLGAPSVAIHNAVGGSFATILDVEPAELERNWRINVMGLFHLARAVLPAMAEAGSGALMVTGNTSALRGKPKFAGFAPTKAAQRILAESIARDFGPQGIHVAYFIIDAVINVPWARQMWAHEPEDFFIQPDDIAAEVFRVAHQPKSAWSFQVEMRPWHEAW